MVGSGMGVVAIGSSFEIAVAGLFVAGIGFLFAITSLMAGIYARVPDEFRARVLALWAVAFMGSRPISGLIGGTIADALSVRTAVGFSALVATATAVVIGIRWRS